MGSNPTGGMDVCSECCVLSSRGLCDELITQPEESHRLLCVIVCDLEKQTSWMKKAKTHYGPIAPREKKLSSFKNKYFFGRKRRTNCYQTLQ